MLEGRLISRRPSRRVKSRRVPRGARGGIGRRARFRSVFRKEWWFDSTRAHHSPERESADSSGNANVQTSPALLRLKLRRSGRQSRPEKHLGGGHNV